ncbi:phosphate ABC transporter substrate-binding protein PstS family protein [Pseudoalteromonas sp. MMG010]|uniref:PstS family phosphate ABC transporter substrate-binding protein n=1 Tax=Pseudoalteromonas sp. MMG010 TaxID=2822685 RepID=UPI001B3A350C|nr:phosphate ABC transporter substrate-binding protein PstS family protein [Pseudoalteromonas sp. MMG010]MBQ4832168.1 phosphate ABC transporter substrate-binding protein PstS family protein [Pseudoalteromonas sp. MMG010]
MKTKTLIASIVLLMLSILPKHTLAVESDMQPYDKISGVSGNFSSTGSDTLANMMTFWAEEFNRIYPNLNMQIQAAGSSTAPPALTEGTANIGPMSRKMKSKEIEAFEKRYGYKPTEVRVAIDALAIFVHQDNPIKGLRIDQVDAIFSTTRQCGSLSGITRWGELGLTGDWAKKDIQLYGRNSVSGTYGYFKQKGLCKGDFRNNVNEQPGSASVVQSISSSLNAIGYSGIGYTTSGVRTVPISKKSTHYVEASMENVAYGKYPLARFLYVYVNKHPNKPLRPVEAEFLRFVLSKDGQAIVEKDGYVPLSTRLAHTELTKLGLE